MLKRISLTFFTILLVISLAACDFLNGGGATTTTTGDPQTAAPDPSALQVHYIDCGQADAILILTPTGESMLIDTGDNENESRDAVLAYLHGKEIDQLDWLVLTHPHADHIGGAEKVLTQIGADKVLMPDKVHTTKLYADVLDAIQDTNATLVTISDKSMNQTALYAEGMDPEVMAVGSYIDLGQARLRILGPVSYDYGSNLNNYSVLLRLEYGSHSFLFTGDAEVQAEEDAMARFGATAFRCNVLKSGHHGSDTSSAQSFVQATRASIAVISVGEGNDYGHPCAVTLDKYEAAGMHIYRTDLVGTVVLQTTGTALSVVGGTTVDTDPPASSDASTSGTTSDTASSTSPAPEAPDPSLMVHAIPCGAGEAFLVTSPDGKHMLIDTGSNSNAARTAVQEYLRAQGVTTLEWLVLTNNHENHIGGASMVVNSFTVKNVLLPNKAHNTVVYESMIADLIERVEHVYAVGENQASELPTLGLTPESKALGSTFTLGTDVTIAVLGPLKYTGTTKLGDVSVVLRMEYGTTSFLFTGNISGTEENALVETYPAEKLSATVLKVANHGALTSSTQRFLALVSPDIALLSADAEAETELSTRLTNAGCNTLFQTVADGAVVLESNGTAVVRVTEGTAA